MLVQARQPAYITAALTLGRTIKALTQENILCILICTVRHFTDVEVVKCNIWALQWSRKTHGFASVFRLEQSCPTFFFGGGKEPQLLLWGCFTDYTCKCDITWYY